MTNPIDKVKQRFGTLSVDPSSLFDYSCARLSVVLAKRPIDLGTDHNRRGPAGVLLTAGGVGLLSRGITNVQLKRLVGLGGGRQTTALQKSANPTRL